MAIRSLLKMGNPLLFQKAKPVQVFDTPELDALLQDMRDTMLAVQGVGIAAPQIGVSLQVVMFGSKDNPRYPYAEPVPDTILINPEITELVGDENKQLGWEGCLSVPDYRGVVPRYKKIQYRGYDQLGNLIEREVSDFHARVVQHEVDHLLGTLFPMRIEDMHWFGHTDEVLEMSRQNRLPEFKD